MFCAKILLSYTIFAVLWEDINIYKNLIIIQLILIVINPSGVILCLEVKESHTICIYFYIIWAVINEFLHIIIYQVFQSNTNNLHTVAWHQALLPNTDNLYTIVRFQVTTSV